MDNQNPAASVSAEHSEHPLEKETYAAHEARLRDDTGAVDTAEAFYASVVGPQAGRWAAASGLSGGGIRFRKEGTADAAREPRTGNSLLSSERSIGSPAEQPAARGARRAAREGGDIGYKLLRKAGWRGSGGLGANEQGIADPIEAWQNLGRRGIGSEANELASTRAPVENPAGDANQDANMIKEPSSDSKAPKRDWERVKVDESVETKAEADDRASKAIDRYMFKAFRDDNAADSNPLTRRNNLSVSNPLL